MSKNDIVWFLVDNHGKRKASTRMAGNDNSGWDCEATVQQEKEERVPGPFPDATSMV